MREEVEKRKEGKRKYKDGVKSHGGRDEEGKLRDGKYSGDRYTEEEV